MSSPQVLGTSLDAGEGPHIELLRDAGLSYQTVDRDLDLWDGAQLISAMEGVTACVAGSEPYPRSVLEQLSELRVLSRTGVGYDAIDLDACNDLGIAVAITPGVNHDAVAEHAIAMMMALARRLPTNDEELRRGVWNRVSQPRVKGSTLGIMGLGRIGRATAERGLGLGMTVIAVEPKPDATFVDRAGIEVVTIEELFSRSDYLSLHCPATEDNQLIVNETTLAAMKPHAVIINTARGALIDERALIAALNDGRIRAAGLDVFAEEPLPADSPLLSMPNVLLSGHVAGLDDESHRDTYLMAAETILSLRAGDWPAEVIVNSPRDFRWK